MRIELINRELPFLRLFGPPRLVTNIIIAPYQLFEIGDARCIDLDMILMKSRILKIVQI